MDELNILISRLMIFEELRFDCMCRDIGHEPVSAFWTDFSAAEFYGEEAVRETYEDALKECEGDVEFLAELTLVLNWKIWDLYKEDEEMAKLYEELWKKHDSFCWSTLKGEESRRYFEITD